MSTLQEIADRAGVTPATVSNVLRGGMSFKRSDAKVRAIRIRRIAEELGYRPNLAARATASGRFGCIALIRGKRPFISALPARLLDSIESTLSGQGLHLSTTSLDDDDLSDPNRLPKILEAKMCDGILLDYTHHVPQGLDALIERQATKAVWINRKRATNAVFSDEVEAGRRATESHLARGHARVIYVDLSNPTQDLATAHYSVADRETGYRLAMREAGLREEVWRCEGFVAGHARAEWLRIRLEASETPAGAFISYGPSVTNPLALALKLQSNNAPIIDFRTHHDEWHGHLRHWEVPDISVGAEAVKLLLESIQLGRSLPAVAVKGRLYEEQAGNSPDSSQITTHEHDLPGRHVDAGA